MAYAFDIPSADLDEGPSLATMAAHIAAAERDDRSAERAAKHQAGNVPYWDRPESWNRGREARWGREAA